MSESITAAAEYSELLGSIKRTIMAGRLHAARSVDDVLMETYWEIGRDTVVRRREQGWRSAGSCANSAPDSRSSVSVDDGDGLRAMF
jgi:hypothetical protein